jgi:hypothetical protein
MIRLPINQPRNILTYTERPPHVLSAVTFRPCNVLLRPTFFPCNVLLLKHFVSATFYYFKILSLLCFTTATIRPCNVLLVHNFDPYMICPINWCPLCFSLGSCCCVRKSTFLPGLWQNVHFCFEAKCGLFVNFHRGIRQGVLAYSSWQGQAKCHNCQIFKVVLSW